jgi:uncharacterized membrane protein YphA (DoxX/SURF4 family)
MNVALWCAQVVLAVVFAASGAAKSTMSRLRLAETGQTGAASAPMPLVRFTATMELAAAVGLIVPGALDIASFLAPLAAIGLAIVMVGAAVVHVRLGERRNVAVNALLCGLCLFVAVGRFGTS